MQNNQLATQPAPSTLAMAGGIEARESQQVQMAMLAAKRFPRDIPRSLDRILNSCSRKSLAVQSLYSFARGGTDISGPSIRLAEAVAQQWGNIESGWRELDRYRDDSNVGTSTIESYAWDLETNARISRAFFVKHWRDTKKGGYALTDERDIYELCANQAARRLRACILAVIPVDIVEEAVRQCEMTLMADADAGPEAQKKIVETFYKYGVTKGQIEARIQRRMDAITPAQVFSLRKIATSLKDGMSAPADWFDAAKVAPLETPIDPFAGSNATKQPPLPAGKKATEAATNETPDLI